MVRKTLSSVTEKQLCEIFHDKVSYVEAKKEKKQKEKNCTSAQRLNYGRSFCYDFDTGSKGYLHKC